VRARNTSGAYRPGARPRKIANDVVVWTIAERRTRFPYGQVAVWNDDAAMVENFVWGRVVKAVLVGPIQQENLALGVPCVVRRESKGHEVEIVAYAYRTDLDVTVPTRPSRRNPISWGLGIAFSKQHRRLRFSLLRAPSAIRGYRGPPHVRRARRDFLLGRASSRASGPRHGPSVMTAKRTLRRDARRDVAKTRAVRGIAGPRVAPKEDRVVKGPVRHAPKRGSMIFRGRIGARSRTSSAGWSWIS